MIKSMVNLLKKRVLFFAYYYLAILYSWGGNYDRAISYLNKLTRMGIANCVIWGKLGKFFGVEGNWFEAKKAFLKALYFNRRHPHYLYYLGKAQANLEDAEGALKLYEMALAHNQNCRDSLFALGNLLMKKGSFGDALLCYYKLIGLQTKNPEVYNNIGLCLMQLHNLDLAETFFAKAVSFKVKEVAYAYNYGLVLLKKGHFAKAIEVMKKYVAAERAEIFSSLAYCYSSLGKYEESLSYYKKALLINPSGRENLVNLACIYARVGENTKALEILKKLLRVNPYDANLFNNIAWIYENLKNYGEAEKNYYRGLALSPQDSNLMHNLLCCLHKQNKHCEAMEIISVLKRIPEWSNLAWSSLARIYEKMGEKTLAVDCYNRALGLN